MLGATVALSPSRLLSDERLASAAVGAVRRAGVRAMPGLNIMADEGRVWVQGLARSFYEKQLVLHAVRHVPGVREIIDEVNVQ
jgi:hypothetical protein